MNDSGRATLPRPNEIIDTSNMTIGQWVVILLCTLAMAMDGYDVMSIALAAASLKAEWGLTKAQLGLILPLEFLGMAIGAIFMGSLSDLLGRKKILLICLVIVSVGMALSAFATNMLYMGSSRVFTGIGIGGILATVTAFASEYSNNKNRALAVILVAGGYTLGIFFAGKLGGHLLETSGWRAIFKYGAMISVVSIPFILFLVPDSVALLEQKKTEAARSKISKILARYGKSTDFTMVENIAETEKVSPKTLFKGKVGRITAIMTLFYLGQIFTYYFFVKWMPPEVVELGYSQKQSGDILSTVSLWGLFGSFVMAGLSRFIPLKNLMIVSLVGAGLSVACFPFFTSSFEMMSLVGGIAGFWLFAVISGAFGMFAISFPKQMLASGSGLVLGLGRGGAITGPWAAGLLFASGMTLSTVSPIMAMGSFVAAVALFFLPKDKV